MSCSEFQSTLLMRGATRRVTSSYNAKAISIHAPHARSDESKESQDAEDEISIHAPHARSDNAYLQSDVFHNISIHAPHARSDLPACRSRMTAFLFQSTLLMRGATRQDVKPLLKHRFQSTLLMRGATCSLALHQTHIDNFNPRSSCEERQYCRYRRGTPCRYFNPRSSCEERPAGKYSPHRFQL